MQQQTSARGQASSQTWHGRNLVDELNHIIEAQHIDTLFQPIFDFTANRVFAYEALSRGPADSPLKMPEVMFSTARDHHLSEKLDYICRSKAMQRFVHSGMPGKLTINICPGSLVDPDFRSGPTLQALHASGLDSSRVILELTEQKQVDVPELKAAVGRCRDMGFLIARDDLGAGYSNLRLLADLRPDYLKLDKYFVAGVDRREVEADFVRLIVDLARRVGCQVIAEGIETVHELCFVRSVGVDFGQGYLLGRPQANGIGQVPNVLLETTHHSAALPAATPEPYHVGILPETQSMVGALNIKPVPPCSPNDMLRDVLARFQENDLLLAVPVVDQGRVVGVLTRDEMLHIFSRSYAHSLYHRSAVSKLMSRDALVVQLGDSTSRASQLATRRSSKHAYIPLIVCDGNSYVGMLSIRALLENITSSQVEYALQCNPLSGLPGNLRITAEVQSRMDAGRHFVLAHFDLDNFKAFNDFYGFERGDRMISLMASVLDGANGKDDFVGHIGGDDFVMLLADEEWEARIHAVLDTFKLQSALLYDEAQRQCGYIETSDRSGHPRRFALASLSVSAVICHPGRFTFHLQATEVVAEVKRRSKKIEGNSLVVDRRH